jgi:prefoldin subunit 5
MIIKMALTEYELNLIDEQIDAYCRTIKRIRKQILELERKKLSFGECEFCSFDFDIVKKNDC